MVPPPIQMPDISAARTSLVNSPHKSVMAALEFKAADPSNEQDEAWESIKAKGVKRLNEDLYCCLKVDRNATASDIKKAYRKMSLLYHPDKTRVMESSELFQVIKKAYELLSDEQSRASYDHRTKGKKFADEYKEFASKPKQAAPKQAASTKTKSTPSAPSPPDNGPKTSSPHSSGSKPSAAKPSTANPSTAKPSASNPSTAKPSASKPSTAKGLPPAPYSLRVVAVDATSVTLAWKTREDILGITFELQTKLVEKVGWPKSATGISKTACRKKNLSSGTKYSFTVRSVLPSGVSEWSIPLNVCTMGSSATSSTPTPPPPPSTQEERRHDPYNNYPYTFDEFFGYYGGRGEWDNAPIATGTETRKPPKRATYTAPKPPKPPNKTKQETAPPVPPLKMQWACTVCKRSNPLASSSCSVCGTSKGYTNDRMNNISESSTADAMRAKERERLRERMQASARAAEQDESNKASARSGYVPPKSYVPPPAAGGWARQDTNNNPPPPPSSAYSSKPSSARSTRSEASAPPPPPSSTSSYSSSYSYVNIPSTSARTPRSSGDTPKDTAKDTAKDVKAASAARKARRAAMRDSLNQPSSSSPSSSGSSSGNPLHHSSQSSSTPAATPRAPVSTTPPPPSTHHKAPAPDKEKRSALSSARRALGKKVSAGIRQVKTAMA